jgi:phosphoglycerate kinase
MIQKATLGQLSKYLNTASQVVVRADFNVPIKDGKITDLNRIKSIHHNSIGTVPTITELLKHNPKSIVLLSHLGRPNG